MKILRGIIIQPGGCREGGCEDFAIEDDAGRQQVIPAIERGRVWPPIAGLRKNVAKNKESDKVALAIRLRAKFRGPLSMTADEGLTGRSLNAAAVHGRPRGDTSADEVILVDGNDEPIGTLPKRQAHQRGLRHRAISVIVGDRHGRILLQQRAAGKYHSAGLWTNTCCSHPRPGEDVADAAIRRLAEEMGFVCPLTFLFSMPYRTEVSNGLIEDEIVHVFGGRFDGTPDPDPLEVSAWCWKPLLKIARDVDVQPETYTTWFRKFRRDHFGHLAEFFADPGSMETETLEAARRENQNR